MKMPNTVPLPPSRPMPPMRQAVTPDSSNVSKPERRRTAELHRDQRAAEPRQRPRQGEGQNHRPVDRDTGGTRLRPPPADRIDLAAPDREAQEQRHEHEDHDHRRAERRQDRQEPVAEEVGLVEPVDGNGHAVLVADDERQSAQADQRADGEDERVDPRGSDDEALQRAHGRREHDPRSRSPAAWRCHR